MLIGTQPDGALGGHGEKVQGVVGYLAEAIRVGRLVPGQRLVEADLTRDLGISRGLLREALRVMAAEGLVDLVPNRGALVRRMSRCEALELFEIRTELEAYAARRAAGRVADPCVRATFETAVAEIWDERPRQAWDDYIAENRRFHGAVLATAGNGQLLGLTTRLQLSLILSQVRFALAPEVLCLSLREHRQIATAILDRDAAAADRAAREHLERAADLLRTMPDDLFRPAEIA